MFKKSFVWASVLLAIVVLLSVVVPAPAVWAKEPSEPSSLGYCRPSGTWLFEDDPQRPVEVSFSDLDGEWKLGSTRVLVSGPEVGLVFFSLTSAARTAMVEASGGHNMRSVDLDLKVNCDTRPGMGDYYNLLAIRKGRHDGAAILGIMDKARWFFRWI